MSKMNWQLLPIWISKCCRNPTLFRLWVREDKRSDHGSIGGPGKLVWSVPNPSVFWVRQLVMNLKFLWIISLFRVCFWGFQNWFVTYLTFCQICKQLLDLFYDFLNVTKNHLEETLIFERDRRSIAFLQIAILRSDKSRKVGQIATRCSVLRALLSIVSIAEYCERCWVLWPLLSIVNIAEYCEHYSVLWAFLSCIFFAEQSKLSH